MATSNNYETTVNAKMLCSSRRRREKSAKWPSNITANVSRRKLLLVAHSILPSVWCIKLIKGEFYCLWVQLFICEKKNDFFSSFKSDIVSLRCFFFVLFCFLHFCWVPLFCHYCITHCFLYLKLCNYGLEWIKKPQGKIFLAHKTAIVWR